MPVEQEKIGYVFQQNMHVFHYSGLQSGFTIMGNRHRGSNSGAMRVTMESRALIANNVIAENKGGPYLQRS